jgi:Zn-finger nucleic acid-binding protein
MEHAENIDFPMESIEPVDPGLDVSDYDKRSGLCPSGHGIMIRARVDIDEPFYLEKCTACGGIWFDNGEWVRIAGNNLASVLGSLWSKAWQRKQRREKSRDSFLEMNRRLFGDLLFEEIMELSKKLKKHTEKDRAMALLQQEIQ